MTPIPNPTPSKPRQRYDESFKRSAVEHWLSSGKKARIVAAELGVSVWNLRDWKERLQPSTVSSGTKTTAELETQIRSLQAELRRVSQQRDILKKTLGILADPHSNASNA